MTRDIFDSKIGRFFQFHGLKTQPIFIVLGNQAINILSLKEWAYLAQDFCYYSWETTLMPLTNFQFEQTTLLPNAVLLEGQNQDSFGGVCGPHKSTKHL